MGDPKLLAAGADAHHKAIQGLPANGVCSEAQLTAINAAIGRMIASVPESTTMGVYNATSATMDVYKAMASLVGSSPVPNYLFSKVNPQDAIAAYNGLLEFKDVVKAAQR